MPTYQIECDGEVTEGICLSCNGPQGRTVGFTYRDDQPYGIYAVDWCEQHPSGERSAYLKLTIGEWGDETTHRDRYRIGVIWQAGGMSFSEEDFRPDDRDSEAGAVFLSRELAVEWEGSEELWRLVDQITEEDPVVARVAEWLYGERDSALSGLQTTIA